MRSLLVVTSAAVALVVACRSSESVTPVTQQVDGGPTTESPIMTFACGATTCNVHAQACCLVDGRNGCFPISEGCGPADGGPDATNGGLECTTYRNCTDLREDCCYDPTTGASRCTSTCPLGSERLCNLDRDLCGPGERCAEFDSAPLLAVGRCERD